jgi:hypothetical protein
MHENCSKHIWADLEIWRSNPDTGYAPFHPAPIGEVERQIAIEARHVEMITGYEFFSQMEAPESTLQLGGPAAVKLFEDYEEYRRRTLNSYGLPEIRR